MRKLLILISLILISTLALVACGGGNDDADNANANPNEAAAVAEAEAETAVEGDPVRGEELYMANCIACHGVDAKGVPGLGKSLHPSDSEFVQEQSDAELIEFIKVGRQPDHPLNTTGVAMPPKGGSPALTEEGIADIVAYMRTLD